MQSRKQSETSMLFAGIGRCDITPAPGTPQGGWGAQTHERGTIADMPMYATALALKQDENCILILDVDAIGFDAEWTGKILGAIVRLTGVPREGIRFSCSHTHSGPNTFRLKNISSGLDMVMGYLGELPDRIAGAAWQAMQQMVPVRAGAGMGECHINRNRRIRTPEGETVVGVNEEVPADSSMGVIRFDRLDGSVLATVVHYACHPTTIAWQNERFTPDYPGPMRKIVEEQIGGLCLFLQGAAGDLGPRRGFTGDLNVYHQLGKELGLAAANTAYAIATQKQKAQFLSVMPSGANIAQYAYEDVEATPIDCTMLSRMLQLPVKQLPQEEEVTLALDALRSEVERLRSAGDLEKMRSVQAQATQMGWRLENVRSYGSKKQTEWPLQVIRIGSIALVSMAGEPFSSIGERIRAESPASYTFVSGYSNGGFGYIPDRAAYLSGGYEVEATPFSPDAADIVVDESLKALRELFKTKEEL